MRQNPFFSDFNHIGFLCLWLVMAGLSVITSLALLAGGVWVVVKVLQATGVL